MTQLPFNPERMAAARDSGRAWSGRELTVSQLTALVKRVLTENLPATLCVMGEISNCKRHSSGHIYFTLKDDKSELACVVWRSDAARLKFDPGNGLEIIATGRLDVYEKSGKYQFYAHRLEPRGAGALELAFKQLRDRLAAEGLFNAGRKKPLPRYPRRIAVVTSPTGAALRDILQTLARRFPCVELLVYPVQVQGDSAKIEIAQALDDLAAHAGRLGGIDLVILGRGGGSLEDLWAFNEETVARAIFRCPIPVISAVGHETDLTISDLVADVRAATPTAAAELAAPVLAEVLSDLEARRNRCSRAARRRWELAHAHLARLESRPTFRMPLLAVRQRRQTIDESHSALDRTMSKMLAMRSRRLAACERMLATIQPQMQFARRRSAIEGRDLRLRMAMIRRLRQSESGLGRLIHRLEGASPRDRIAVAGERLTQDGERLRRAVNTRAQWMSKQLVSLRSRLEANSHAQVLRRGYSIARRKKDRKIVATAAGLHDGDRILTETADGTFESRVVDAKQLELFEV